MKAILTSGIPSIVLLLLTSAVIAQDSSVADEGSQQRRLPYEVVITPDVTLGSLKKLLVQIEDDFFDKFNELNIDDDYDVQCYRFKPTGSHISQRVCEPNFFMGARADNSSEVMFVIGCNCPAAPPQLLNRKGLRSQTGGDFDVLQEKLDTFYRSDAELNAIGEALAKIKSRVNNFSKREDN